MPPLALHPQLLHPRPDHPNQVRPPFAAAAAAPASSSSSVGTQGATPDAARPRVVGLLLSLAPRSFLAGKSAKAVLRSTAAYFPSLTCVNLHHTAGWCDPVQVTRSTIAVC